MSIQSQAVLPNTADVAGVIRSLTKVSSTESVARTTHSADYWIIEIEGPPGSVQALSLFLNYESECDELGKRTPKTLLSAEYSPSMFAILNRVAKDLGGLVRKNEMESWQEPAA